MSDVLSKLVLSSNRPNSEHIPNAKQSINCTTSNILQTVEQKYTSNEERDDHFKSEYYLRVNRTISKAKFAAIDCISPTVK